MANSAYPSQDLVNAKHSYNLFDDFEWYISPHRWTSIVADGGSIVLTGGANGLITLTNDPAADHDEIYVHTTTAIFTVAAGKDLYGECRLTFTESNTDDDGRELGTTLEARLGPLSERRVRGVKLSGGGYSIGGGRRRR